MTHARDVYANLSLDQVPRLLGNQDRNPFSPTFGCFHRDYWLEKVSDFPDAVRQFAVHSLAIVYKHEIPGNRFRGNPNIRDWAIAGLDYWTRIQHKDGSFDEFYPYERGWVGPTAFTTYACSSAFELLREDVPPEIAGRVVRSIRNAAEFISAGQGEDDHLANHHAMACLSVWKAHEVLGEPQLRQAYDGLWQGFLEYYNAEEGWSREYDGVDPGYLSATISFLAKMYQINRDPDILRVLRKSVEFAAYFVYPDGSYAGNLGSRNTQHFYPHGFEILSSELPLAASIADKMLAALDDGKLVPPGIMSDRYVAYRVAEYLQAYLDYGTRPAKSTLLPFERPAFSRFFPEGRIQVLNSSNVYAVSNLAKGGVIKVFGKPGGQLILNDSGMLGETASGEIVTTQWIDPDYECTSRGGEWMVSGQFQSIPTAKVFTPLKQIIFRVVLLSIGWSSTLSHVMKGAIRRALILGRRPVSLSFSRMMTIDSTSINVRNTISTSKGFRLSKLTVGGDFSVRYVPQSRYFQRNELETRSIVIEEKSIRLLNEGGYLSIEEKTPIADADQELTSAVMIADESADAERNGLRPPGFGVYDLEYHQGREEDLQLKYRLRRRTSEVEEALRKHANGSLRKVIDLGTADGLMIEGLLELLNGAECVGIDLSLPLLRASKTNQLSKVQADVQILPIGTAVVDALIATAVIEHVPDASQMLKECARVLQSQGILVITTPDPKLENIAKSLRILNEPGHHRTFGLDELATLATKAGFEVLEKRKFMFSPIGFPAERQIEKVLRGLRLDFLMANQLLVLRSSSEEHQSSHS